MDYRKKKAVILGGTHGMGLATAKRLIGGGAELVLTGANETNVSRAARELGAGCEAIRSDITQLADIEALAAFVEARFGFVDALFVFAGIAELAPFERVSPESFARQLAVNAWGPFFSVQRLTPLVGDGGSITMTTVTPAPASPTMSVYMASKGAVTAFSRVLAAELLPRRIRVNTLAPGFIDTPTLGVAGLTKEEREEMHALGDRVTPMGRHGTPDEVARAALFLAFDATYTTGVELAVDGGLSAVSPMS